ncbi:MAG: hypothetical protein GY762_17365 [Proteobacteria bacterium]|nr:hypothetical protein [Pseudomonadota bacterium]
MKTPRYLLLLSILSVTACGGAQPSEAVIVENRVPVANPLSLVDLAEDNRTLSPTLHSLVNQTDREIRLRLAVAVGRIGDPKGSVILEPLLSDPDPGVREAAYFASGMLGTIPKKLKTTLLFRLGVEDREQGIIAIIDTIGRSGTAADLALLFKMLGETRSKVRERTLQALGFAAVRGLPIPPEIVMIIARYLDDPSDDVRLMSAFALSRIPRISPSETVVQTLAKTTMDDPSAEVRILALVALAKWGGFDKKILAGALGDVDGRARAVAVRSIAHVTGGLQRVLVELALETVTDSLGENKDLAEEDFAHVARSALEIAIQYRGLPIIKAHAARIAKTIERLEKPRPAGAARILCLARLVAGRNSLSLLSCDPERPEAGKQMVIQNLYHGSHTPTEDIEILKELTADTNLQVATTAVAVLGGIDHVSAKTAVLDALGDKRIVVVTAALDTIVVFPNRFKYVSGKQKNTNPVPAIGKVVDRFAPFEHAHAPLVSSARALQALEDPSAKAVLLRLGSDSRPCVRHVVLDAFNTIKGLDPPAGLAPLSPVRPFPHEKKQKIQKATARAVVMTSRGGFSISLNTATAPGAVESFITLADSGFFDDTPVHRVVPGSLVQAGDPTGTGLGDPGYSLRGEPSRIAFVRGTVGMAQSTKDTAGSQFFITLSRKPEFDGNYTVLGQVASGMETVNLLEEGDTIEEILVQID